MLLFILKTFADLTSECNGAKQFAISAGYNALTDSALNNPPNCCTSPIIRCNGGATSVITITLTNRGLSGAINWSHLGSVSGLVILDLSINNFLGAVGTLPNSLATLDLSSNGFTGTLNVYNLNSLKVNNNYFTAIQFTQTTSLTVCRVLPNPISNPQGLPSICSQVMSTTKLGAFSTISPSPLITTKKSSASPQATNSPSTECISLGLLAIPLGFSTTITQNCCTMSSITCDPNTNYISEIDWSGMGLSGNIPSGFTKFTAFTGLTKIDLSNNQLTGSLFDIPFTVVSLNISGNLLDGTIPGIIGGPNTRLSILDISKNQLSGELSGLPTTNLNVLYAHDNQFTDLVLGNDIVIADCDISGNSFQNNIDNNKCTNQCQTVRDFAASYGISIRTSCCLDPAITCQNGIIGINWSNKGLFGSFGNHLTRLQPLPQLTTFDVSQNQLTEFHSIGLPVGITTLKINNNLLNLLELNNMFNLITFDASFNNLTSISQNSLQLTTLYLNNNAFADTIDFSSSSSIRSLRINNNKLDYIYLPISVSTLTECNVSNNNVTTTQGPKTQGTPGINYFTKLGCTANNIVDCGASVNAHVNAAYIKYDTITYSNRLALAGSGFGDARCYVDYTFSLGLLFTDSTGAELSNITDYQYPAAASVSWTIWHSTYAELTLLKSTLFDIMITNHDNSRVYAINPYFSVNLPFSKTGKYSFGLPNSVISKCSGQDSWQLDNENSMNYLFTPNTTSIPLNGLVQLSVSIPIKSIFQYTLTAGGNAIGGTIQVIILSNPKFNSVASSVYKSIFDSETQLFSVVLPLSQMLAQAPSVYPPGNKVNNAWLTLPSVSVNTYNTYAVYSRVNVDTILGNINATDSSTFICTWDGNLISYKSLSWASPPTTITKLKVGDFPIKIAMNLVDLNVVASADVTVVCENNQYPNIFGTSLNNSYPVCAECSEGALCDSLGLVAPLGQAGYYKVVTASGQYQFIRCYSGNACVGESSCARGYKGTLCGSCAAGYYKTKGVDCEECPHNANILIVAGFLGVIIVIIILYLRINYTSLFTVSAILFQYFQILYIYKSLMLNWSEEVLAFFNILSVFSFNIELAAPECINPKIDYFYKSKIIMSIPPLFLVVLITGIVLTSAPLNYPLVFVSRWFSDKYNYNQLNKLYLKTKLQTGLNAFHIFLTAIYVLLCSWILGFFSCVHVGDSLVMVKDPTIVCYSGIHKQHEGLYVFMTILYVIGIPMYFIVGYNLKHQTKYPKLQAFSRNAIYFKNSDFKDTAEFTVAVYLCFKLAIILCQALLNEVVILQAMFVMLITFLHVGYLLHLKPYKVKQHTVLDICCQICCVITLSCGIFYYVIPLAARKSSSVSIDVNGWSNALTVIVIITTVFLCLYGVKQLKNDIKRGLNPKDEK